MPEYKAPLNDIAFLLHEVHGISSVSDLPGYEESTPDVIDAVITEGAAFCEEVLFPLNQIGDAEGCTWSNGTVKTPSGFRDAYLSYSGGGWTGLAADPKWGGQGLPESVRFVMEELLCSANLSFSMYPGLSHGAYSALVSHGSEELKAKFLPNLVKGSWSGTMCLTEAHAGTDLGLIRTRAVPGENGSFHITGTKIFISAGEHDLTENILHLVLARLPDAPDGTRGISMFLVPRNLESEQGRLERGNGVSCGSIEHKMGIKGSSTCVINFDDSVGWLVGEPNKGMRAMFVMMNSARLAVGMQGLGLSEVAYQNALAYARDRLQGRALTGPVNLSEEADPIIVHPDVRKGLLRIKSFNEGARSLAYRIGMLIDVEHRHSDPAVREEAADLVALMTPVIKGFFTDMAFENTNIALQTLGGHGYIREFGMEQFVRDARIAQIYEGTNAVQAMDLVGRKLAMEGGRPIRRFLSTVRRDLEATEGNAELSELAQPVVQAISALNRATALIAERGFANPNEAGAVATDYLHLMGYTAIGWQWVRMATVAFEKLEQGGGNVEFMTAKLNSARFWMSHIMPQTLALSARIKAGAETIMGMKEGQF